MLKHKLRYEEKILEKDISTVTADLLADLNWKLRGVTFDIGSRLVFFLIRNFRKPKNN